MDWVNWVGNEFYTMQSFIDEALKYGVSRRIQERILRTMTWQDRIFLATNDIKVIKVTGKRGKPIDKVIKTPVIIGYFKIDTLHGINLDPSNLPQELKNNFSGTKYNGGAPSPIQRGCGIQRSTGYYVETTPTVDIKKIIDLQNIVSNAKTVQGGLRIFERPVITHLLSFRGFRKFDGAEFMRDYIAGLSVIKLSNNNDRRVELNKGYYID